MTTASKAKDIPVLTALTDSQVADFLCRNPDFLVDKPHVMAELNLPHHFEGKAVSLVERQVSILRERNMDMRHRLNTLLDNARTNDLLFEKTKRLILSVLDTDQLDDCLDALFFGLQNEFDIQFASLLLIQGDEPLKVKPANQQAKIVSLVDTLEKLGANISDSKAICGQLNKNEQKFVFGDNAHHIGSTAMSQLKVDNELIAILAIGNRDVNYYRASMNTLFLNFIAEVLSRTLKKYV